MIYMYIYLIIYIMRDNWTIDWEITNNVVTCGEADVINRPLTQGGVTKWQEIGPNHMP